MAGRKKKTLGAKDRAKRMRKAASKTRGRPKKDLDWDAVEACCRAQATQEEVASFLGVSVDTLSRRIKAEYKQTFMEYSNQYSANGLVSVRRAHFKSAEGGDVRAQLSILNKYGDYGDLGGGRMVERTRIFYPDNGRDPDYVEYGEGDVETPTEH